MHIKVKMLHKYMKKGTNIRIARCASIISVIKSWNYFYKIYLSKLTQEEIKHMNVPITIKEI